MKTARRRDLMGGVPLIPRVPWSEVYRDSYFSLLFVVGLAPRGPGRGFYTQPIQNIPAYSHGNVAISFAYCSTIGSNVRFQSLTVCARKDVVLVDADDGKNRFPSTPLRPPPSTPAATILCCTIKN